MPTRPLVDAIELPDGTWVRGRGLRRPAPGGATPEFGLYLGGPILHRRHEGSLPWSHEWVYWPDGLLPRNWQAAADSLLALHERARAGQAVEIACHGGHGRTGTAMACLVTLTGLDPHAALRWTRAHYSRWAVEVPWQRGWVRWFARHHRATGKT